MKLFLHFRAIIIFSVLFVDIYRAMMKLQVRCRLMGLKYSFKSIKNSFLEIHSIDLSFPGTPFRFLTLDILGGKKELRWTQLKKRGKPIRLLLPPLANDRRHIVVKFV